MSGSKNILVVGGDPEVRELLHAAGFPFDDAKDSTEALSCVGAKRYDLVMTDLKTPGEEDLAFVREIRRASPGTPVIVMSAEGTPDVIIDSVREHAFSYFTKPFNRESLNQMINEALEIARWDDGIELLSALPNWVTLKLRLSRIHSGSGDPIL